MEQGLFPTQDFQEVLKDFVEARLHNDIRIRNSEEFTPETLAVRALEEQLVGHFAIPYYLILDPETEEVLARHELAAVNQRENLLEFLQQGRAAWQARRSGD